MLTPHLIEPSSGWISSARICIMAVCAISFSPMNAILSPFATVKEMSLSTFTPSIVLLMRSTVRTSLPISRSMVKPTYGYFLEEAGNSSTVSLSMSFLLEVACLDLDLFAAKRAIKFCSSLIFSSALRFWSAIMRCISRLDSYQKS